MVLRSQRPGLVLPDRRGVIKAAAAAVAAALMGIAPAAEAAVPALSLPGRIAQPIALPVAAYMCHSMVRVANWFGPCVTVVRASDSATRDIFFRNNIVDALAIATFLGPGMPGNLPLGYISKWYDQSGNGRHAVQAASANRPAISPLGAINGVTPISMAGTLDGTAILNNLQVTGISLASQALSVFQVAAPNNSFNQSVFWEMLDGSAVERSNLYTFGSLSQTTDIGLSSFDGTNVRVASSLSPQAGQWALYGFTNNASNCVRYVNTGTSSLANLGSFTLTTMNIGANSAGGGGGGFYNIGFNAVFSSVLSAGAITQLTNQLNAAFQIGSFAGAPTQLVLDGDSSLTGYGTTGCNTVLFYLQQLLNRPVQVVNMALYGTLATTCQTNFTANIAPQRNSAAAVTLYLPSVGGNDIAQGATGATTYNTVKALCAAAKSAGYNYTAMATFPDQVPASSTTKTQMAAFNTLARAGVGVDFDILFDTALDTRINSSAAAADRTIWNADLVHLTSLGQWYEAQNLAAPLAAYIR